MGRDAVASSSRTTDNENAALWRAIDETPHKVPMMVKSLRAIGDSEIGDSERIKPLFLFQDAEDFQTPLMRALHRSGPNAIVILGLIVDVFENDPAGLKKILMAQSTRKWTLLMFLVDAQIIDRIFKELLGLMLHLCKSLGHEDFIEILSQTNQEQENILMIMCRKRPEFLYTLFSDLLHGFRPEEFKPLLLQKNRSDENLFTYARQQDFGEIRARNLWDLLSLAYRLDDLAQVEFIEGCIKLPGHEALEGANVGMAVTRLFKSGALNDFLHSVANDEAFAEKMTYFPKIHKPNGLWRGPNALQLAIQQNEPEKVHWLLLHMERTLETSIDSQRCLQKMLRHWPSYSSAEKGGNALWLAIRHCPEAVPELLAFMHKHDPQGLRDSLICYTYDRHKNRKGQVEARNLHRIMTHASTKLSPEAFQSFLDIISEQGLLVECLKNSGRPKGLEAGKAALLSQVGHCFAYGTLENTRVLLKKISEMEPMQQKEVITLQVLKGLRPSHSDKSLTVLKEVFEHLMPWIHQNHPEMCVKLLNLGVKMARWTPSHRMKADFRSMLADCRSRSTYSRTYHQASAGASSSTDQISSRHLPEVDEMGASSSTGEISRQHMPEEGASSSATYSGNSVKAPTREPNSSGLFKPDCEYSPLAGDELVIGTDEVIVETGASSSSSPALSGNWRDAPVGAKSFETVGCEYSSLASSDSVSEETFVMDSSGAGSAIHGLRSSGMFCRRVPKTPNPKDEKEGLLNNPH